MYVRVERVEEMKLSLLMLLNAPIFFSASTDAFSQPISPRGLSW